MRKNARAARQHSGDDDKARARLLPYLPVDRILDILRRLQAMRSVVSSLRSQSRPRRSWPMPSASSLIARCPSRLYRDWRISLGPRRACSWSRSFVSRGVVAGTRASTQSFVPLKH